MIAKKYYKLIRVSYADSDYFRVTNVSDQSGTLTITRVGANNNRWRDVEYSTDGVNWNSYDLSTLPSMIVPSGSNVYFRGTGLIGSNNQNDGYCFNLDVNHTVSGNVYSLLDKSGFTTRTTSIGDGEFQHLFDGDTHLISAKDLNFGNVAAVGAFGCHSMFSGCTSLTEAPSSVPSFGNRMAGWGMFQNCTSLTVAPELTAETMDTWCYMQMFSGCSALNTIRCLATSIGENSTQNWVYGVAATGTFYKSANMSGWTTGNNGIPSGWTVVDVQ